MHLFSVGLCVWLYKLGKGRVEGRGMHGLQSSNQHSYVMQCLCSSKSAVCNCVGVGVQHDMFRECTCVTTSREAIVPRALTGHRAVSFFAARPPSTRGCCLSSPPARPPAARRPHCRASPAPAPAADTGSAWRAAPACATTATAGGTARRRASWSTSTAATSAPLAR